MLTARVEVSPRDRPGRVDARRWAAKKVPYGTKYAARAVRRIELRKGSIGSPNKAVTGRSVAVCTRNFTRWGNGGWHGLGRAWWVEGRKAAGWGPQEPM